MGRHGEIQLQRDRGRGVLQFAFRLVIPSDKREIKSALHKLQQPAGLGFNQLLLSFA